VDLPHPEGPIIARTSLQPISMLTFAMAQVVAVVDIDIAAGHPWVIDDSIEPTVSLFDRLHEAATRRPSRGYRA
jgi:hypothetical protein